MRSTGCFRPLTAAAVTFVVSSPALAAVPAALTWDADPATPGIQDGPGTWDTTFPKFFSTATSTNYVYDNAANHDVRFGNGGTTGLVTIGTGVSVHSLTFGPLAFGANRYILAATGTADLALTSNGSTDPTLTTDSPAEISAPITSSAATITKLGTGLLVLSGSNRYTGTLRVAAGTIIAPAPSALPGSGEGRLAVLSGGRLSVMMANDASGWQDADVTALANTTPFAAGTAFSIGVASGNVTYSGRLPAASYFTKFGTGTLVLTTAQAAPTMIALSGGLTLAGAGRLPSASTISFNTPVTLTVGANINQSIALFDRIGSISASMTVNGAGSVTAAPGFAFANSVVNDLSGLGAFTYAQSTALSVNGKDTTVKLAGVSSVTAPGLNVGTENTSFDSATTAANLILGTTNTFNVDAIQIGTSRATGSVTVASGTGSLVLRGANGTSRVGTVTVGLNRDYSLLQTATLNLGALNLDAQVGSLAVAGSQNGWGNVNGTVAMNNGMLDSTAINLASTTGSANSAYGTTTAKFEQNGGLVRTGQLTMCGLTYTQYSGDYKQIATYILGTAASQATLAVGSITGGVLPNATTVNATRTLNFNNGRLTTLDADTDLTVTGASGGLASERPLNIVLGTTGLHALTAPAGRAIRVMDTAPISGSGALTIDGAGTVYLSAVNTYTGGTVITNGMLRANKAAHAALLSNGGTDVRGGRAVFTYLTAADDPAATIRSFLTTSHASGFATGTLRSTTADATHGLGYADSGSAVTVMATLYGDANLDGGVSINDFNALAVHFGRPTGNAWTDGDFNYDGGVSINDFNLLASGFGQSIPGSPEMWAGLLAFAAAHNDMVAFEAATGVPEPTALMLGAMAMSHVLQRRRNRMITDCPSATTLRIKTSSTGLEQLTIATPTPPAAAPRPSSRR